MATVKNQPVCKSCGGRRPTGFLATVTGMCLACAQASARSSDPGLVAAKTPAALKPAAQGNETNEEESGGQELPVQLQVAAEEATGGDKGDDVSPSQGTANSRKRRLPPSAANPSDGVKLTPACASCKRSKIRCPHRRAVTPGEDNVPSRKRKRGADDAVSATAGAVKDDAGNDNGAAAPVGAESETPPPAKKRVQKVRFVGDKPGDEGGKVSPEPSSPTCAVAVNHESGPVGETTASLSRQSQGRTLRKRKFVEEEEEEGGSQESDAPSGVADAPPRPTRAAAAADDDVVVVASTGDGVEPPRKRSRRGRKPNGDRVAVETVVQTDSAVAPVRPQTGDDTAAAGATTVAPAPGPRSFPPFPRDTLEGAALLSQHTVLSRELQQRLEEAETRWNEAVTALHAAKQALDNWVEVWRSGQ
ncbi:hypothetical protein ASPZODRAFT_11681 [Penicilliopsis zonata CBS 506.65]|uniref:Uncharacterized protein n=1 Tax=Penicilliopsis zonata CBS 506.65 TaxID=1073090 RepID=A0A1L9SUE0_9EURO|nr:hypothetical protein ASPZODRAFT_11681 [Penicilliopsis zonata CBS 506.65]OJJ50835.1 hypothetical protein ASPZODRAFT_11681 [Penicilliopsis zonata CBS 506.65]